MAVSYAETEVSQDFVRLGVVLDLEVETVSDDRGYLAIFGFDETVDACVVSVATLERLFENVVRRLRFLDFEDVGENLIFVRTIIEDSRNKEVERRRCITYSGVVGFF